MFPLLSHGTARRAWARHRHSPRTESLTDLWSPLHYLHHPPGTHSPSLPTKEWHHIAGEHLGGRMMSSCPTWIRSLHPCTGFPFNASFHSTLWGAAFRNMNHKGFLRIWYSKHKCDFLWIHLLHYSLQINDKFYKLAHLRNDQIKPVRLRKGAGAVQRGWTVTGSCRVGATGAHDGCTGGCCWVKP